MHTIEIAGRKIGPAHPPYVIAELSANHNGSLTRALDTITAAHQAGADAIKLQTYTADTITLDCDDELFMVRGGLWDGQSLYQLYQSAYTPWEWHAQLFAHARALGLACFSSPFDPTAVDFLEQLNAPAYKIASFEAIDLPLIEYVARTGKPMIISTGMCNLAEITDAVSAARDAGCQQIALLHCISGYPTPMEQANLATIGDLAKRFGVVVGLSDHTLGTTASIAACALGASVIEKHFILDRADGGADSSFSINPGELEQLTRACHEAWLATGHIGYELRPAEQGNVKFRRSLFAVKDIAAGERLTTENVRSIRPGNGLPPKEWKQVIGRKALTEIRRGTPLSWSLIGE